MKESENNFEALRRLLAFKNREIPPPGYFNNFSSSVISRIRAGEADTSEQVFAEASWLLKLFRAFEFKPAFAGVFASLLCLVLVFGIVYAERPDIEPQPLLMQPGQVSTPLAMTSPSGLVQTPEATGLMGSNNPVLNFGSVAAVFNPQGQSAQQVGFVIPGN